MDDKTKSSLSTNKPSNTTTSDQQQQLLNNKNNIQPPIPHIDDDEFLIGRQLVRAAKIIE